MQKQLDIATMEKAVRGVYDIAHPVRLRVLEFLDVNGASSVSAIAAGVGIPAMTSVSAPAVSSAVCSPDPPNALSAYLVKTASFPFGSKGR